MSQYFLETTLNSPGNYNNTILNDLIFILKLYICIWNKANIIDIADGWLSALQEIELNTSVYNRFIQIIFLNVFVCKEEQIYLLH